jgi:hypothetical protein
MDYELGRWRTHIINLRSSEDIFETCTLPPTLASTTAAEHGKLTFPGRQAKHDKLKSDVSSLQPRTGDISPIAQTDKSAKATGEESGAEYPDTVLFVGPRAEVPSTSQKPEQETYFSNSRRSWIALVEEESEAGGGSRTELAREKTQRAG